MKLLSAILLLSVACIGQDAPSQFWTKQQVASQSLQASLHLADGIQTCYHLAQGWREDWLPTQSCAAVMGWMAGSTAASVGLSYWLHKRGHRKLALIVPYAFASGSAVAIGFTYSHHQAQLVCVPSSTNADCHYQ